MKNCIQTLAIYINYEKGQCKQEKIRIMKDYIQIDNQLDKNRNIQIDKKVEKCIHEQIIERQAVDGRQMIKRQRDEKRVGKRDKDIYLNTQIPRQIKRDKEKK